VSSFLLPMSMFGFLKIEGRLLPLHVQIMSLASDPRTNHVVCCL
jgi:hypothetical protein